MMRLIRFLAVIAAATACLGFTVPAKAAPADDAAKYISGLAQQTLNTIADKSLGKDQKQKKLEMLFSDNVDFPWVGRFVMGRFWRQTTPEQQKRYLQAYQKFLILHYTSRFTEYTSGSFKVTGAKDDGDGEFTVSMQIQSNEPNAEPVLVDYRVRKEQGDGFKVFDVIVEGVSMITTQRSEFASVITNNGVDYLINLLETKSRTGDINLGGPEKKS